MSKIRIVTALFVMAVSAGVFAQDERVSFPSSPAAWLNSPPLSAEAMQGKGAVLYFFEDS